MAVNESENESIEIELFIDALLRKYNYDFRGYSRDTIKRRLKQRQSLGGFPTICDMISPLLHSKDFFLTVLDDLSVNTTEMFRDPECYRTVKKNVLPELAKCDIIKIWHAGCSSGEEVYSMAIMLMEARLYDQALIYATDFNATILTTARDGIYPVERLQSYIRNYRKAGGLESFTDYYAARYELVLMEAFLREKIVFSNHNLAVDGAFSEVDFIICRNVLIYFNKELQERVLGIFSDCLRPGGFLWLGAKESLTLSKYSDRFEDVSCMERIYRKK